MPTSVFIVKTRLQRVMGLITSNSYRDRDKEFITSKALAIAVEESWKGERFEPHPLLYAHRKRYHIGDVIYAEMDGVFLIEVAKERIDGFSRATWDWIESDPAYFGVSHGFEHFEPPPRGNGRTYRRIKRLETSVLPLADAANPFTGVEL